MPMLVVRIVDVSGPSLLVSEQSSGRAVSVEHVDV